MSYSDPIVRSNCDVKSLTYCDLLCIPLDGLHDVLSMYPEIAEKFESDLVHDLTYILREGYVEAEDDDATILPSITVGSSVQSKPLSPEHSIRDTNENNLVSDDVIIEEKMKSSNKKQIPLSQRISEMK